MFLRRYELYLTTDCGSVDGSGTSDLVGHKLAGSTLSVPGMLWEDGSIMIRLPGCLVAWLPGCLVAWLPGCLVAAIQAAVLSHLRRLGFSLEI
ncbi:MAG: hypothetical protein G5663_06865 [Serratia symbiotica]|nr:hypothetical protein [Serratia symbiotica]